jgi:DNA polymerase-3 subunit epsilon
MNKILFVDTETGGINPDKDSLLSIGLVLWEDGSIKDSKEIFIKHEEYFIVDRAKRINRIEIDFLNKYGINELDAISEVMDFCKKHFKNNDKVTLAGHNITFDVGFLKKLFYRNKVKFGMLFSHRYIDTATILKYLYIAGKINVNISSSDAAFKHFNIKVDKRHSALNDAIATAELFTNLLDV